MVSRAAPALPRFGPFAFACAAFCATGCLDAPEDLGHAPVVAQDGEDAPAADDFETVEFEAGFAPLPTPEDMLPEDGDGVSSPEEQQTQYDNRYLRTPADVWFKVYEVQFANDENCADLESVSDEPNPPYISFASGTRLYDGLAPYGTYRCIALTVDRDFRWSGRAASACEGQHEQTLFSPDGGNTVTLYLTTADLRTMSTEMDGAPLYVLDRAYEYSRTSFRTRFELNVWDTVDSETCTMQAPGFKFRW